MNLTKAQQKILDEMRKPGARAIYMPYMGSFQPEAYWFLTTTRKRCTRQIEKLIKLGLVRIVQSDLRGKEAILTQDPK